MLDTPPSFAPSDLDPGILEPQRERQGTPVTPAQVSALTALALADGDEYVLSLLASAVYTDRTGAQHVLGHTYAAKRLAQIAAELEAA